MVADLIIMKGDANKLLTVMENAIGEAHGNDQPIEIVTYAAYIDHAQ